MNSLGGQTVLRLLTLGVLPLGLARPDLGPKAAVLLPLGEQVGHRGTDPVAALRIAVLKLSKPIDKLPAGSGREPASTATDIYRSQTLRFTSP